MAQSFKDFKKQLKLKKEQEQTLRDLNGAVAVLTKKRDDYAEKAKDALRKGNDGQYKAMVALLKNAMFNLAQAQDMVTNYTIAKDMCEMQQLNKKFVKSLDGVMKNVYKTCKAIKVSNSEKTFMKALYRQNQTSFELQQALKNNNSSFSSSVNTISDITDEEVNELLGEGVSREEKDLNDSLSMLENEFSVTDDDKDFDEPKKETMSDGLSFSPSEFNGKSERKEENESEVGGGFSHCESEQKTETKTEPKTESVKKKGISSVSQLLGKNKRAERTDESEEQTDEPEDSSEFKFNWDSLPSINFDDIAGLDNVKEIVKVKVLLPLKNPEAFEGYEKKNGGGMCLYGPPGTGKTMIAAAIANEIGAKFCSIKPSDLLHQGMGVTERAVRALFAQARKYPCAVIYFDEMDSITPKNTKSTATRQLRSEFLAQLQGIDSYKGGSDKILFLIAATNKPWDIDSAFLRPGRFGTKVYVGLPDAPAREYMIVKRIEKILGKGVVEVKEDIDIPSVVEKCEGFNCSDISNLLDKIEELSILRGIKSGEKYICHGDFMKAFDEVHSSVQNDDIRKLNEWKQENDS